MERRKAARAGVKGRVEIRFTSDRELERVMEILSVSLDSEV